MSEPRGSRKTRLLEYVLGGGWRVLVGRSDADNEELSLRMARPDDWWFHVRGVPGSHVLLPSRPGDEPGRGILKQAAAIAAYHSKAREGGVVAVSCARGRDVSKPRGSKLGTVTIRKETLLKVRPSLAEASEAPGNPRDSATDLDDWPR
jgi:predicted ribosome quality control (RQC) complex YloA/Tae2 family protein